MALWAAERLPTPYPADPLSSRPLIQPHPSFAEFQAAIQEALDGLSTTHAESLKSLMTLNFQRFEDISLMAA